MSWFGDSSSVYLPRIDALLRRHDGTSYEFLDAETYAQTLRCDAEEGQRLYWLELLQRAHLGAVTSILRARRWIDGTLNAVNQNNLLAAAASLRGLIEAAADTVHGLGGVPETLAASHAGIEAALARTGSAILISKELEDRLLHFLYARKLDPSERDLDADVHRALPVTKYNEIFAQAGVSSAGELYSLLCQFTHPAAHSLLYAALDESTGYRFDCSRDRKILQEIAQQYRSTLAELPAFAFNAGILTLAILNTFSVERLHTPEVNAWNLTTIPLYRRCLDHINATRRGDA